MSIRLLPYGDRAVLVEVGDSRAVLALRAIASTVPGVLEAIPAARTLLIRFDPLATSAAALASALESVPADADVVATGEPVELVVRYDGADLAAVADELAISTAELVHRHTAGDYTVAFCGFAPGFAYLTGLDPVLHVARLAAPRTAVPAGSVGLAGEFTGVYPRASPGGWRLLGRTDAALWDTARTPPALLTPGTPVRFRAA